jgi:hypothetical protein
MANEEDDAARASKQAALAELGKRLVQDQAKQRKQRLAPGQAPAAPAAPPSPAPADSFVSYVDFEAPPAAPDEIDEVLKKQNTTPPPDDSVNYVEEAAPAPAPEKPKAEQAFKIPKRKEEAEKTDVLGTIAGIAMYVVPVVLALALVVGLVTAGRSEVNSAQAHAQEAETAYFRAIDQQSQTVIDGLAALGSNANLYVGLRDKMTKAEGAAKVAAADDFVEGLDAEVRRLQVAKPAEARPLDTPMDGMNVAKARAHDAEAGWAAAAGTFLGGIAITFHAASGPPTP